MLVDVRIIRVNPPSWIPTQYKDSDGHFSFDLDVDTAITITKQIDEATELGKLKQDTIRDFTLPNTEKNKALIGPIGSPTALNFFHRKPIPVKIFSGSHELPEQEIRVIGTGDRPFEVEAFSEANVWIEFLKKLKIKDLPFSPSETPAYDWAFFDDIHQNHYYYQDGELPVFLPFVNYGRRKFKDCVSLEDLRLWHSPLNILQLGFCVAGWTFRCPLLESEFGRRLWIYILSKNFAEEVTGSNTGFNAILTSAVTTPPVLAAFVPPLVFDNDSVAPAYDNGGYYDNVTGKYSGLSIKADYTAVCQFTGTYAPVSGLSYVQVLIVKKNQTSGVRTVLDGAAQEITVSGTYTVSVSVYDIQINSDEEIFVEASEIGFSGTIDANNSKFSNFPKSVVIGEGSIINIANIINPDLNVLDLLKGMVHLFNLKPETNSINNIVSFYPEDEQEVYNEGVQEGFFYPNQKAKNWTSKVQVGSLKIDIPVTKNKRNYRLEFKKDNQDKKVNDLPLSHPLHSKNIDFGFFSEFREGTTKSPNPFFAPTVSDFDFNVRYVWSGSTFPDTAPYMPFIWGGTRDEDGNDPEPILDIVPRIILAFPFMRMTVPQYGANEYQTSGDVNIAFSAAPGGKLGKAWFSPCSQIFPQGFFGSLPSGVGRLDEEAIVYGTDEYNATLPGNYELFYDKAIQRLYYSVPLEFLIKLSFIDIMNFSHRDKIFIRYFSDRFGEINFFSRVVSITDHVLNKDITTPVLLLPTLNVFDFKDDCCECGIAIIFDEFEGDLLQYTYVKLGDCGKVDPDSIQWTLSNETPGTFISGPSDQSDVLIGTVDPIAFTLTLTLTTDCGSYEAKFIYT